MKLDIAAQLPRLQYMSQQKNAPRDREVFDEHDAPRSNVQVRTRPMIERVLAQIAEDCVAGVLTPDEGVDRMIEANVKWAAEFLSEDEQAELRELLTELANTHPLLLAKMGRSK